MQQMEARTRSAQKDASLPRKQPGGVSVSRPISARTDSSETLQHKALPGPTLLGRRHGEKPARTQDELASKAKLNPADRVLRSSPLSDNAEMEGPRFDASLSGNLMCLGSIDLTREDEADESEKVQPDAVDWRRSFRSPARDSDQKVSDSLQHVREKHLAAIRLLQGMKDDEAENEKLRNKQAEMVQQLQDSQADLVQQLQDFKKEYTGCLDRLRTENEQLKLRQDMLQSKNEMLEGQVNELELVTRSTRRAVIGCVPMSTQIRAIALECDAKSGRQSGESCAAPRRGVRSPPLTVARKPCFRP